MKSVLRLMTISMAGPGKLALFGIWGSVLLATLAMQLTVLADLQPARRSLFATQLIVLCGIMMPWSLMNSGRTDAASWWLLPWGNLKVALAQGFNAILVALLVALCHANAVSAETSLRTLLTATLTAYPSTFVLISLFGLQTMIWTERVARHFLLSLLLTVGFVLAVVYSLARGLPLITDPQFGAWVWLAFAGSVLTWLLGGWSFARRPASQRRREWQMRDLFEGFRAQHLMELGPAAAVLRARWRPTLRSPMLVFWALISFLPMLMQPANGGDGFIAAAAYFGALSSLRAFVIAQEAVRQARTLWLVSGDRLEVFRICERMLLRNIFFIACLAGPVLLLGAWLLDRLTPGLGIVMGLVLCVSLPLLMAYLGLMHLALPESAQWWFGNVWLILISIAACGLLGVMIVSPQYEVTIPASIAAVVSVVLIIGVRQVAMRAWKRVDWTFLPPPSAASHRSTGETAA